MRPGEKKAGDWSQIYHSVFLLHLRDLQREWALEMLEGVTHGFASVHGHTIKTQNDILHMMNFSRSWGYFKCKKIGEATPVDLQNCECYLSE